MTKEATSLFCLTPKQMYGKILMNRYQESVYNLLHAVLPLEWLLYFIYFSKQWSGGSRPPRKRVSPDVQLFGEMIFGSVEMTYKGPTIKAHSIR
jgi:hypothetical protein